MFPSVRRAVALGAALVGLAAAASANASAAQYEQFNRVDGVAGIAPYGLTQTKDVAISDDGRYVYFVFFAGIPQWSSASGLWRRDVLENRTKLIASGTDIKLTGLSADGAYLGFTTRRGLVADDQNTLPDVYRYTTSTGTIELASRGGGSLGSIYGDGGLVTRNGRAALFQGTWGVYRRDLVAGTTDLVSDNRVRSVKLGDDNGDVTPQSASADGTVFVSGKQLVLPLGRSITLRDADGRAYVDEAGTWALSVAYDTPTVGTLVNIATGERRTITLAAREYFFGFNPSGAVLIQEGSGYATIDPATGARTSGATYIGPTTSRNGRYATTATLVGQNQLSFLAAIGDATIPGGTDLPSATGYVTFIRGCARNPFFGGGRASTVGAVFGARNVPLAKSVNLKAYLPNGAAAGSATFTRDGTVPVVSVGTGAWKLTATITLVDGRVITETQDMQAIGSTNYCSVSL